MVEIPDSLRCVFSMTVRERNGKYVVDIPSKEIDHDSITPSKTYRVAVLELSATAESPGRGAQSLDRAQPDRQRGSPEPPVNEGEVRDVTIETVGDQGDGIAKVDRGYVVIVPEAQLGDEPTVEIDEVRQNVAFASVVDSDPRTL